MTNRPRFRLAVFAALPLLVACDAGASGNDGDCSARIRYEGVIYRPHNALNQSAPQGTQLGADEVVDCGDAAVAPKVDEVTVFSVEGVATSIALMAGQGDWRGIYVAEDLPQSDWPHVLRNR